MNATTKVMTIMLRSCTIDPTDDNYNYWYYGYESGNCGV